MQIAEPTPVEYFNRFGPAFPYEQNTLPKSVIGRTLEKWDLRGCLGMRVYYERFYDFRSIQTKAGPVGEPSETVENPARSNP
jgi:hypothetical protein